MKKLIVILGVLGLLFSFTAQTSPISVNWNLSQDTVDPKYPKCPKCPDPFDPADPLDPDDYPDTPPKPEKKPKSPGPQKAE